MNVSRWGNGGGRPEPPNTERRYRRVVLGAVVPNVVLLSLCLFMVWGRIKGAPIAPRRSTKATTNTGAP